MKLILYPNPRDNITELIWQSYSQMPANTDIQVLILGNPYFIEQMMLHDMMVKRRARELGAMTIEWMSPDQKSRFLRFEVETKEVSTDGAALDYIIIDDAKNLPTLYLPT